MTPKSLDDFFAFVAKREQLRLNRRRKPYQNATWTDDPILAAHRFCNVNREDDAVTLWIKGEIRDHLKDQPNWQKIGTVFITRIINEPATLTWIRQELINGEYTAAWTYVSRMIQNGDKVLRGAYLVAPHGKGCKGLNPVEYYFGVLKNLCASLKAYGNPPSFEELAKVMELVEGCGPFYINQVIADLRYIEPWKSSVPDWSTFVLAGPGTMRGLNRLLGRPLTQQINQRLCQHELLAIRLVASKRKDLSDYTKESFKDINNLSNCFCEYDKYCRAMDQLSNNKRTTLRKYGNQSK